MTAPFPLTPAPSYYASCSFPNRNGVFYVGGTAPSVTLSQSGATSYTVRDYYGNTVSSGSFSGTTCTPTAPSGGWTPGWYRIYFTGTNTDSLFGPSYAATNFVVIRPNSNFIAMPAAGTFGGAGGESRDMLMKGVMGIGTSRLTIGDVTNLTAGADALSVVQTDVTVAKTYWSAPGSPYSDAARPRSLFATFPNGTVDFIQLPGSGAFFLTVYAKDGTIDTSKVYVSIAPGSSSGSKVTVYFPNATTVVETYDNLANSLAAATAINAASAYVKTFIVNGTTGTTGGTQAATVIGNAHWTGVVTAVSALYPDVTRFEGPSNEPPPDAEHAHQMRLFQAAVRAGNASALAIGPCPVKIAPQNIAQFFTAGGGAFCDEISFHSYNSPIDGNLDQGRANLAAFQTLLAQNGLSSKPLWQTEATQAITANSGVYQPRHAQRAIIQTLLWEQYGIPRERNPVWYDVSHGFWAFPAWLENGDTSLNPHCVLYRTLAEETFGQTHSQQLDFGQLGNHVFIGSVYQANAGAGTAVLMAASYMPNATVTLTVTGTTSPLTVIDAFGNSSTVAIANGRAVIPVAEVPTYVRLPTGVSVTVYSCNDWPQINTAGQGASSSGQALPMIGGQLVGTLNDGTASVLAFSSGSLPDTGVLTWPTATRVDRVMVFMLPPGAAGSVLVDFDVQTSLDGSTWTTQATVTKTTPSSFQHGTNSTNVGCERETFWDEQWIFDVKLPAPVACKAIRIYVRATSYGGAPDAAAQAANGGGSSSQQLALSEIVVLCDDNTKLCAVRQ